MLAGASGLDREITWAHVCELPDPTEWLGKEELLMTVGFSIPEGPDAQEALVERLVTAGLSGLLICDLAYAPDVTYEMLSAADRLSFPILLTAYEVPFTAISRTVGEANRSAEHARLLQVLRVYETVRLAVNGTSGVKLFDQLGALLGCEFFVLDPKSGGSLLVDGPRVPEEIAAALTEEMTRRSQPMPAILRLHATPQPTAALLVPASRPAALVAAARTEDLPDLSILHHITGIAVLEIERLVAEYERKRRLGSELLAGLIDGRIGADSAAHLLSEWNLSTEPRVLACCTGEGGTGEHSDLHLRLGDRGIPHLLLRRAPLLAALLPDRPKEIDAFRREIDPAFPIGLSDLIGTVSRVPDAYREAQWALQGAKAVSKPISRYGDDAALSPFLPRNLSETDRAVSQILGPLLDYDATHGSQLVASLKGFLAHNRSWQRAASDLHVHKQTLVYRMRRVEALSGRRLDRTGDVAELWLAIQAAEASGMAL
ncbi:MAG: PucR family transcriptional regulator [Actinomycetota bacterium]|nr:PucR family transcriptional regulator [Actinomycetota bacterium]